MKMTNYPAKHEVLNNAGTFNPGHKCEDWTQVETHDRNTQQDGEQLIGLS